MSAGDVVLPYGLSQSTVEALRQELLIRALILGMRTAMPVKVMAVHPGEGSPPGIGTVDVQPLVQGVDGSGTLWSLVPSGGAVYGVPFVRLQAGGNAMVIDPAVNDIGLAVACDRDISSALAAAGAAAANDTLGSYTGSGPGSQRVHDISDLVYVASVVSAAEITQYFLMNSSGITLFSPGTITIQGAQINLEGPVNANGATISSSGEIEDAAGVVLGTHEHSAGTYVAPDGGGPVTGDSGEPT